MEKVKRRRHISFDYFNLKAISVQIQLLETPVTLDKLKKLEQLQSTSEN